MTPKSSCHLFSVELRNLKNTFTNFEKKVCHEAQGILSPAELKTLRLEN